MTEFQLPPCDNFTNRTLVEESRRFTEGMAMGKHPRAVQLSRGYWFSALGGVGILEEMIYPLKFVEFAGRQWLSGRK
jgi:hypothetical protein